MSNLRYPLVTNVIFEVDGVLLDTKEINSSAIRAITQKRYHPIASDKLSELFGFTEAETIHKIIKSTGINKTSYEGLLYDYREFCRLRMPNCGKMPGVSKLINHLHSHNIPIAIATTNTFHSLHDKSTNHRDIFDLFHHIVYAPDDYDVKSLTKNKDLFEVCAQRFLGSPSYSRCLVFENTPRGVEEALNTGMQVIWVTPSNYEEPQMVQKPSISVRSLEFFQPQHFGLPPYCSCDLKK